MEKYTIDYCKNNKVAIHVSSECEAISVINILNANKVYWDYFASDNTRFHHYKEQTCYSLIEGLMLGDVEHYKNDGFEIITAAQFLADNNTPKLYTEAEVLQREEAAFNASRETDEYGLTDTNGNTKLKYENFNHYNTKP